MKQNKSKEEKYIQIGIKKDGKVIKSEEYSIGDFFGNIWSTPEIIMPKIKFFDMIFGIKKLINSIYGLIAKVNRQTQKAMMEKAIRITNMKEFGKKTKYPLKNRFEQLDK